MLGAVMVGETVYRNVVYCKMKRSPSTYQDTKVQILILTWSILLYLFSVQPVV